MKQPTLEQRKEYVDIVENSATIVPIRGTKKTVKLRWIKPYTMERITKVWIEREMASASVNNGAETLKDLCKEPYFAFKEAALMILNNDLKIRLFYGIYWRWLAFLYDETQVSPIIEAGKKKVPVMAHYEIMVFSQDMRLDMMRMTKKEAEQYRAELLLGMNRLSSKTSQNTDGQNGGSSVGSETSGTDVSSPAPK